MSAIYASGQYKPISYIVPAHSLRQNDVEVASGWKKYPTHNVSFFPKLSGDAVHGDRSGEADEAAEAVGRKNSVFGLSDAQRA